MGRNEHSDHDFAWLAQDSAGQVAVFTTGGEGPIPAGAVPWLADSEAAVRSLGESSGCQLLVTVPRPDDFVCFCKRGFFAYDWVDVHRKAGESSNAYELVARPSKPAKLVDLPLSVRRIVESTSIASITFGASHVSRRAVA
jgi:hypothetical protein